jgi:hypothetical protein
MSIMEALGPRFWNAAYIFAAAAEAHRPIDQTNHMRRAYQLSKSQHSWLPSTIGAQFPSAVMRWTCYYHTLPCATPH